MRERILEDDHDTDVANAAEPDYLRSLSGTSRVDSKSLAFWISPDSSFRSEVLHLFNLGSAPWGDSDCTFIGATMPTR